MTTDIDKAKRSDQVRQSTCASNEVGANVVLGVRLAENYFLIANLGKTLGGSNNNTAVHIN